jgi:hypothetical protein
MKKIISTIMLLSLFAFMVPLMPLEVNAGTTAIEAGSTVMAPCRTGRVYRERARNVYQRNRKLFNTLIAAGIGTAVGSIVDGKRGALIGAGAGGGGYLLYRYVKDRRGRCRKVYVRS